MPSIFDATSIARNLAFLDDCPASVLSDIITLPLGALQERVVGARVWHNALLRGELPDNATWPGPTISGPIRKALADLDIPRFCKGRVELVDTLLKDIVASFARRSSALSAEVAKKLQELEQLERIRLSEEEFSRTRKMPDAESIRLDEATLQRLRARADRDAATRPVIADAALTEAWAERARAWAQISQVFGDLGEIMGRGFDLSSSILKHVGWLEILKLRELIEQLPQLREIVQQLGRLHMATEGESVAEKLLVPVRRIEEERREVRTPLAPTEMRGIERSGEISRMLPAEAALLGHPKLRLLWHARRAERALLTYRVEGVMVERVEVETEAMEEVDGQRPRPQRGPILAIIDTSGSMHGLPERVAKAVVLEAMRTAHAENRACYLYCYSGPGAIEEHELSLSGEGIGRLLQFLSLTFGGGNDESGMMQRVVERLQQNDWKKADVVFVSDGVWPAPPSLTVPVMAAREAGTRFHGVQVGNRGRTGLHAVCDPVHEFGDWAKLGGWSIA